MNFMQKKLLQEDSRKFIIPVTIKYYIINLSITFILLIDIFLTLFILKYTLISEVFFYALINENIIFKSLNI